MQVCHMPTISISGSLLILGPTVITILIKVCQLSWSACRVQCLIPYLVILNLFGLSCIRSAWGPCGEDLIIWYNDFKYYINVKLTVDHPMYWYIHQINCSKNKNVTNQSSTVIIIQFCMYCRKQTCPTHLVPQNQWCTTYPLYHGEYIFDFERCGLH